MFGFLLRFINFDNKLYGKKITFFQKSQQILNGQNLFPQRLTL